MFGLCRAKAQTEVSFTTINLESYISLNDNPKFSTIWITSGKGRKETLFSLSKSGDDTAKYLLEVHDLDNKHSIDNYKIDKIPNVLSDGKTFRYFVNGSENDVVDVISYRDMHAFFLSIEVDSTHPYIKLLRGEIQNLDIKGTPTVEFSTDSAISNVYVSESKIEGIFGYSSSLIDTLVLRSCKINNNVDLLIDMTNPNLIVLESITFIGGNSQLDLTKMNFKNRRTKLKISNTNIASIVLDYQYFQVDTNKLSFIEKERALNEMYKNQKNYFGANYRDFQGFQLIDIELKKHQYSKTVVGRFINFVDEWWWYYGYNKYLIFYRTIELMLLIFLINLIVFRYPRIVYEGYTIDEFVKVDERLTDQGNSRIKNYLKNCVYCFIYTGYIFWGVKLNIEKIRLSNLSIALWIIAQYITGIICLAYIVNIIITKL